MKLYARTQGAGRNLISLHGLFGSQENLGMINRSLSSNYRVHALDLRNHGRSPHSPEMNYSLMADDVLEYLDDQKLQKVSLLGHSMGGKVAMTLALKIPDRVSGLVVIDIAPVSYRERRHDEILKGLSSIYLASLKSRDEASHKLEGFVSEQDIRQFLLKNLYRNSEGQFDWRINVPAIINHYSELLLGPTSNQPFPGKTLFIKGEQSDYILPEYKQATTDLFPNARVRVIPNTDHWVHAQQPELVSRTIARFLDACP